MKPAPHLIILTLMGPRGWCGVQTHFNAIAQYAAVQGLRVSLIEPHQANIVLKRIHGIVGRIANAISREQGVLVNRFFALHFLRSLLRNALLAAKNEAVVLYAQDPLSAKAALDLRREGFQFRLVGVIHFNLSEAQENIENGIAKEKGKLWHSLMANERSVLPKLDQIIFVSRFMQNVVASRLPELANVPQAVISNFPALSDGKALSKDFIPADMIAIGTLEARKNQAYLLRVLAECNAMGKRYRLTIAGDGPDRAALEQQAESLGLAGQVKFLGFQPNASRLIPGHKAFVHAARMENLPITLLEALRVAVPVFAAPVGGIPEIFNDGDEGYYLNLNDPREAAEKLISVLEDQQKWRRMSVSAKESYTKRFHPDELGKRWVNTLLGNMAS